VLATNSYQPSCFWALCSSSSSSKQPAASFFAPPAAWTLLLANPPLSTVYEQLLELPLAIQVGSLVIAKPLLLWVNDGLMAILLPARRAPRSTRTR
jgi:hypothetical protein